MDNNSGYSDEQIARLMQVVGESPAVVRNEQQNTNVVAYEQTQNVTTLSDLQSYAKGKAVKFPDFAEGQPFIAMARRPSMLALAKSGKIPNELLASAGSLFQKGNAGLDSDDSDMLKQMYDICRVICEASLVSPTLKEIETAGMELSDDQLLAIFSYTQTGIKALKPIGGKPEDSISDRAVQDISGKTE